MEITRFRSIFLVVFLLGASAINASAQLEVHPRFYLEEKYDDNIFLDDSDTQNDWVTTLEPGIGLNYDTRSVDLSLDYSLRYQFYLDNSDENIDAFKDVQRADARAVFFEGRPFTLTVSETITREALDERDNNADDNDLVNRTTVYTLQVAPEYRLEISPSFSLVFGYTYDRIDYVASVGNDSEAHTGRFSMIKELSSNSIITLGYSYTAYQEDDFEDFDQQDYTIGLTQQVGPRLSIAAEVGYSEVEYDNGRDSSNTIWSLAADYQLTQALALTASYDQGFSTTATEGLTKSQTAAMGLSYEKNDLTGTGEVYWNQSEYLDSLREDDAIGTRVAISIPLTAVFSTSFDAGYERATFEDETDEDVDRYAFGASLGYQYRRILASLGYRFRLNDSDINESDYTSNVYTLSASVRF